MELVKALKELYTNKNFVFLNFAFTLAYGNYSAAGGILSVLTSPYGYSVESVSMFSMLFLTSGIFCSFFYGVLLDKYLCYKKLIVFICFFSGTMFFLGMFTIPSGNVILGSV